MAATIALAVGLNLIFRFVKDLPLASGLSVASADPQQVVVQVIVPHDLALEEKGEAKPEEVAEGGPEVIAKGKQTEEGASAAETAKK